MRMYKIFMWIITIGCLVMAFNYEIKRNIYAEVFWCTLAIFNYITIHRNINDSKH